MSDYTLYTAATPNDWKASNCMEELGLDYRIQPVSFSENEQKAPSFLAINPNGRIPAIVDHAAGDFAVFESGAVLLYLAEKHGQLIPADPRGRSVVTQWGRVFDAVLLHDVVHQMWAHPMARFQEALAQAGLKRMPETELAQMHGGHLILARAP